MFRHSLSLRALLDRLWLYLPLGFVGVLALGSYWLVRTTPALSQAATPEAPQGGVDYRLHGFTLRTFEPQGALRSEVLGERAVHDPGSARLMLTQPRLSSLTREGARYTASAHKGVVDDAQTQLELLGQVHAVRKLPGQVDAHYEGEYLLAMLDTHRLHSHLPVRVSRGRDQFQAQTMEYDEPQQTLFLQGRVRATLVPQGQGQGSGAEP